MSQKEVIRRWLNQEKHGSTGRKYFQSGLLSYEKDTVYSLGTWAIARILPSNRSVVLVQLPNHVSPIVRRHGRRVYHALMAHPYVVFCVPQIGSYGPLCPWEHEDNLRYYEDEIDARLEWTDRSGPHRARLTAHANDLIAEKNRYIEVFGLDKEV